MPSEPRSGKIYVPIDLRKMDRAKTPFVFRMDEEEEPPCMVLEIFSGQAHVEINLDETALDNLFDLILKNRIELSKRLSFLRGAASTVRRKK